MAITPEELAAYADGELDAVRAAQVAAEIAADPALEQQLAAHRALKEKLSAHFAPIAQQPVPSRLTELLQPQAGAGGGAEMVDFTAVRSKRAERRGMPRWGWVVGPALAASLALAVFLPRGGEMPAGYAGPQLAATLDNQLVADQPGDAPTRILLSFRDDTGQFCRAFAGNRESGIACRDGTGWQLRATRPGSASQGTDYRQAGSDDAQLLAQAQDMAAGPALDAAQEEAARKAGWR